MKAIRKIHKYFALVLGIALFIWLISGIAYLIPSPTPPAFKVEEQPTIDLRSLTMPPSDMLKFISAHYGSPVEVTGVKVRVLEDRLVYEIDFSRKPSILMGAKTGEIIEITPEFAEKIIRGQLKDNMGKARVERLDHHSLSYSRGALPVYRIEFENGMGITAYITKNEGQIIYTDWRKKFHRWIMSFHEFKPLNLVANDVLRKSILFISAILCLVIVATGYYMEFFPRVKRHRTLRKQQTGSGHTG